MSKYTFDRLGTDGFESLVQALLEKLFRTSGTLIQFGPGKDGGREATWQQPTTHDDYERPANEPTNVPKEWVFQAKYHDLDVRGWDAARADVESDLHNELEKVVKKHKVPCHKYILITNVPFTGVRHVGTRDKVNKVIEEWKKHIPEIEVWDASNLSRMLDADPGTRTTYLDSVLPGDVLKSLLSNSRFSEGRRKSAVHGYLMQLLRSERDAKAEEAGDDSGLRLERVYVDLDLSLRRDSADGNLFSLAHDLIHSPYDDNRTQHVPGNLDRVPASFALLRADHQAMFLKGGPGVGKSTITQFLTLFQAARIVNRSIADRLLQRLKLTGDCTAEQFDACCRVRIPFRIELRRYAQWFAAQQAKDGQAFLAEYIASRVRSLSSSTSFDMDDVFYLANTNPILLILDGLDEVPRPSDRQTIFSELRIFLDRCEGEQADIQLVFSSRPQGYREEFSSFQPIEWRVVELDPSDLTEYVNLWLLERVQDEEEREDARQRVDDGLQVPAVRQMATTLLQATVMLVIASRKHRIPHARHKLFEKFVDVIFEREDLKKTVRQRGHELRRLHEKVGYQLIRKMEVDEGARTLAGEEFRDCVRKVIEDYGEGDLRGGKIREVVEEIVTLAKDRLCLLAGKGEAQENIDFVLQSFREYFAAAYLARHDHADPDRVYDALEKRKGNWGNVFQFYAGFQSPSQQKAWISEADSTSALPLDWQEIAERTRRRRSLLRILPEFDRPRNEYVRLAYKNLFHESTRWTWCGRGSTINQLKAFSTDDIFPVLREQFGELTWEDHSTFYAELELLGVAGRKDFLNEIQAVFNESPQDDPSLCVAISAAIQNYIPIKFETVPAEIKYAGPYKNGRSWPSKESAALTSLPDVVLLNFAFGQIEMRRHIDLSAVEWVTSVQNYIYGQMSSYSLRDGIVALPSFLHDNSQEFPEEAFARVSCLDTSLSRFVSALGSAIKAPDSTEAYANAVDRERQFDGDANRYLSVEYLLGPPPSDFESIEAWQSRSRFEPHAVFEDWLLFTSSDDLSWLALAIHPDAWHLLEDAINPKTYKKLMENVHQKLKKLSPNRVAPIHIHIGGEREIDLEAAFNGIANAVREFGPRIISSDPKCVGFFSLRFKKLDQAAAARVAKRVEGLKLPAFWMSLLVRAFSSVPGISASELLQYWNGPRDAMNYRGGVSPRESVVHELLDLGSLDALTLSVFLVSGERAEHEVEPVSAAAIRASTVLSERIRDAKDVDLPTLKRSLFSTNARPNEVGIWSNPQIFERLSIGDSEIPDVASRLAEAVSNASDEDVGTLRQRYGKIVENRTSYPVEIATTALEQVLRLDERIAGTFVDTDWQKVT